MKRSLIGWIVAAVIALGGAALAWVFWFAGGSGKPSTELTTPELAATTTTGSVIGESTTTAGSNTKTFVIDQSRSAARFEVGEELRGEANQVIGFTDQVVGQIRADFADLSNTQLSEIVVNARTITTDSENRDRAIRGPVILDSGSDGHELITFMPTSAEGLEGSAQVGQTYQFTLIGDLTIKGSTHQVTFDVSATLADENTLEGTATAEVARDQFGIGIPNVPGVANVSNEVLIALDFTAIAG